MDDAAAVNGDGAGGGDAGDDVGDDEGDACRENICGHNLVIRVFSNLMTNAR